MYARIVCQVCQDSLSGMLRIFCQASLENAWLTVILRSLYYCQTDFGRIHGCQTHLENVLGCQIHFIHISSLHGCQIQRCMVSTLIYCKHAQKQCLPFVDFDFGFFVRNKRCPKTNKQDLPLACLISTNQHGNPDVVASRARCMGIAQTVFERYSKKSNKSFTGILLLAIKSVILHRISQLLVQAFCNSFEKTKRSAVQVFKRRHGFHYDRVGTSMCFF